jgi:RES domain-containing protein
MLPEVKLERPGWSHFRVIHSRFPPTNVFDSVDAEDQLLLAELEGQTNDRLANWQEWMPADEVQSGPGWGAVMASFCHFSPGRFNDSTFGAYYCSKTIETAISEWSYHAGLVWKDHRLTDIADATVRSYVGEFQKELVDVRQHSRFHGESYEESQLLAKFLKIEKHAGVIYQSVRHEEGVCVGLFYPNATTPVRQSSHFTIQWNGERFTRFAELSDYKSI